MAAAVIVVAVTATVLALAPGGEPKSASGSPPTLDRTTSPAAAAHPASTAPTAPASTSTSAPPATPTSPTATPTGTTAVGVAGAGCTSADLRVAAGAIQGSAGSQYQEIVFTNAGSTPCTLFGYPGVALATGTPLTQVGAAADRLSPASPHEVTLPVGGQASAQLRIIEALIYAPSKCDPTPTTYLQIYPPNQTTALYLPYKATACALSSAHLLTIDVVKPGNA